MASSVDIANFALGKLGQRRITSFGDEKEEAIYMNLIYDACRSELLEVYDWTFASRRASLASITEAPAFDYSYQYEYPADCLRITQAGIYYPQETFSTLRAGEERPYIIEGRRILTNYPAPLKIKYIADIVDTTQFTPSFVNFLSVKLAFEACENFSQSNSKKQTLELELRKAHETAVSIDRLNNPPKIVQDGSFMQARLGYSAG